MENKQITVKSLFSREDVKQRFQEMLGKRAPQFITSVLQIVASNDLLAKADPASIYNAAAMAATLDLPLNNSLGMAYIVPYNVRQKDGSYVTMAQFQMGWKSFLQLAQRSGQFLTINSTDVREGEIVSYNRLTGEITFSWIQDFNLRREQKVVGYVAYFRLLNGFEKSLYMSVDDLKSHGKQYSQTFKKGFGLWNDNFEAMANKTVVKLLLSRYAPLSIEMQKAVMVDQAVIHDEEGTDVTYDDNHPQVIDKESERVRLMIQDAKTLDELDSIYAHVKDEHIDLFLAAKERISKALSK